MGSWLTEFLEDTGDLCRGERAAAEGGQGMKAGIEVEPGAQLAPGRAVNEARKIQLGQFGTTESACLYFHVFLSKCSFLFFSAKIRKKSENNAP